MKSLDSSPPSHSARLGLAQSKQCNKNNQRAQKTPTKGSEIMKRHGRQKRNERQTPARSLEREERNEKAPFLQGNRHHRRDTILLLATIDERINE